MIPDPFTSILFLLGGALLLSIVYVGRVNMVKRRTFDNSSYQLGIVFGAVLLYIVSGLTGITVWLLF